MSLSRNNYKAIAKILRKNIEEAPTVAHALPIIQIVDDLADYFAKDSILFDREVFTRACGING